MNHNIQHVRKYYQTCIGAMRCSPWPGGQWVAKRNNSPNEADINQQNVKIVLQ